MSSKFIRMRELATTPSRRGQVPASPATIWRWVKEGRFPQPFKLGDRVTVWDADQVASFITSEFGKSATSDEAIPTK